MLQFTSDCLMLVIYSSLVNGKTLPKSSSNEFRVIEDGQGDLTNSPYILLVLCRVLGN
jgi:hypothetical protein